jgi:HTH-type transcriptional regulator, competence development regulator
MSSLGDRLAQRRAGRGLSLRELGVRTGLKAQNISRVETGERTHVRSDTLERLAEALGCSTDYLLGRTDDPTPPTKRPRSRKAAPVG